MSVYMKNYVMIGYDLIPVVNKKDVDQLDTFLDEMEEFAGNRGLKFIYDGMSGEYCFLGKVLNSGDEEEGMYVVKHHFSDLQTIREEVLELVKDLKIHQYPALYSFTHWV